MVKREFHFEKLSKSGLKLRGVSLSFVKLLFLYFLYTFIIARLTPGRQDGRYFAVC